jgi:hypothetical protein
MARVVATSVTQVDPTRVGHVAVRSLRIPDDQELLMVAAAATHALIEEHFAAGTIHGPGESDIVLLREVRLTRVRAPQQPTHLHAAARKLREHATHLSAWPIKAHVGVAFPVGEVHPITGTEPAEHTMQPAEVLLAIDQYFNPVPDAPRGPVRAPLIDQAAEIAALVPGQKPI